MANEKDVAEKNLEAYNDVFADIVNGVLWGGKEVIKEDELEAAMPRSNYESKGRTHEMERDVSKYWKNNKIRLAMVGLENQTEVDEFMPIRVMGYDWNAYNEQRKKYSEQRKKNKQRIKNGADINGKKGVKSFYPVISIVLYFGYKNRWNKPVNLKGCLNIPEELQPYVNDYHAKVIEVAYLEEEDLDKFKSDFREVANYFIQVRKNNDYVPDNRTLKHVNEVLKLLSAVTGDRRFEDAYNDSMSERSMNMSEAALDKIEARGKAEGKAEGALYKLISQIDRKMQRGQSTTEIADDLLEDEENVQRICDAAKKYGGDEDKIYEAVCSSTMVVR